MNNLKLYEYHLQILSQRGTVTSTWNQNKIQSFYRRNGERVTELLNKISDLQEEFFVVKDKQVVMKKRFFWSKEKPVMRSGKTEVEFNKAFNKLMEEPVKINI